MIQIPKQLPMMGRKIPSFVRDPTYHSLQTDETYQLICFLETMVRSTKGNVLAWKDLIWSVSRFHHISPYFYKFFRNLEDIDSGEISTNGGFHPDIAGGGKSRGEQFGGHQKCTPDTWPQKEVQRAKTKGLLRYLMVMMLKGL